MKICLENGYLITADAQNTRGRGCVHITDDIITYVGSEDAAPAFDPDRTIDADGGIIAPGFINTHTHVPMNLFRSYADDMPLMAWLNDKIWPAEDKMTKDAAYWSTMTAIAEMVMGGVTCFSDMYGFASEIARAADTAGIRATIASAVIDVDGGAQRRLDTAEAFFEQMRDHERIRAAIGPHAEYTLSPQVLEDIRDRAAKLGARLHIHVSETTGEHSGCIDRHGKTPIGLLHSLGLTELPLMAAHCVWVSDEDMDIMAENNVHVMSCPGSNLKLGSGIARTAKMVARGINVSCATDSVASNNNLSMMEEMTLLTLLQKGVYQDAALIPAEIAFRTATINGAKALGLEGVTGSLETGKQADIIIIDTSGLRYFPQTDLLHHLVYSGCDSDIVLTMVGGDILYENGDITFADLGEIKANAAQYAAQMLS